MWPVALRLVSELVNYYRQLVPIFTFRFCQICLGEGRHLCLEILIYRTSRNIQHTFCLFITLSAFPLICVCSLWLWLVFFLLHYLKVVLLVYFSNHSPFQREHIFVDFYEFHSLVSWCIVIHHDRPKGPSLFQE